jgi:hypothetical protein
VLLEGGPEQGCEKPVEREAERKEKTESTEITHQPP